MAAAMETRLRSQPERTTRLFGIENLELRAGGIAYLEGRACPIGGRVPVRHRGSPVLETFAPGCFADAVREPKRVKVTVAHIGHDAIGRGERIEERPDELWARLLVPLTQRGQEVVALIQAEVLTGMSVGFIPHEPEVRPGALIHHRVTLDEIAVCAFPAYTTTSVMVAGIEEPDRPPTAAAGAPAGPFDPDDAARVPELARARQRARRLGPLSGEVFDPDDERRWPELAAARQRMRRLGMAVPR